MASISLLWLFISGCALLQGESTAVTPDGTSLPATNGTSLTPVGAVDTPAPVVTPNLGLPTPVTDTRTILIVWIPPEIGASTEAGGALLLEQLTKYQQDHPELNIVVQQKASTGQGSILNYLRTGRNVAPGILADLIAISTDQLDIAIAENLIFPMDGLVETEVIEDLYPAGIDLAIQANRLHAFPFVLTNMQHLVYNSATVTTTIPGTWSQFLTLADGDNFVFPANGNAGVNLALRLYLAAGGQLINEVGQQTLDLEPLRNTLQGFIEGRNNGFILSQSSNLSSLEESWQLYNNGTANITLATSELYLRNRTEAINNAYAPVPGLDAPLRPIVKGWVWAISTSDATEQQVAGELLNYLIAPENLGVWSYESYFLPARRTAFDFWPETDLYGQFSRAQLSLARENPLKSSSPIHTAINNALFDVISLTQTAQLAAEEAVDTIQP